MAAPTPPKRDAISLHASTTSALDIQFWLEEEEEVSVQQEVLHASSGMRRPLQRQRSATDLIATSKKPHISRTRSRSWAGKRTYGPKALDKSPRATSEGSLLVQKILQEQQKKRSQSVSTRAERTTMEPRTLTRTRSKSMTGRNQNSTSSSNGIESGSFARTKPREERRKKREERSRREELSLRGSRRTEGSRRRHTTKDAEAKLQESWASTSASERPRRIRNKSTKKSPTRSRAKEGTKMKAPPTSAIASAAAIASSAARAASLAASLIPLLENPQMMPKEKAKIEAMVSQAKQEALQATLAADALLTTLNAMPMEDNTETTATMDSSFGESSLQCDFYYTSQSL